MSITINIYYTGKNGAARAFACEMTESGIVDEIRREDGNERYEYFYPAEDNETVLLIDRWRDKEALYHHHNSPIMAKIAKMREKYDLHMTANRYVSADAPSGDDKFLRK